MKSTKLFLFILAIMTAVLGIFCACGTSSDYTVTLNTEQPFTLEVGDEVDYTQYFIVKDKNGNQVVVTEDMLDLSLADTSMPGSFTVTLTIGGHSETARFYVIPKENEDVTPNPSDPAVPGTSDDMTDFYSILASYADVQTWNFAISLQSNDGFEDYYEYLGYNVLNSYTVDGYDYTDYLGYDASTDTYYFYYDKGDGTYDKFAEDTDDYEESLYYLYLIDLSALRDYTFTADGDRYLATDPSATGNEVICEYYGNEWVEFAVYVSNGKISKIVGVMDDGYSEEYILSKQGSVNFTLPDANSGSGSDSNTGGSSTQPSGTMEGQNYNPSTFDSENLQDKLLRTEGAIGLPSTGNYHALVIPVQFVGDTITEAQLEKLNLAFNGNFTDTGWESVQSYYRKSSYGLLNITFDIQSVYEAQYDASYYAKYSQLYTQDGYTYTRTGEEIILIEALSYFESRLDLSDYDSNGDGTIDAVYLIYSASVDYDDADFFWAYTTWYYGENTYDGLDAYYYLFAGFDFMDESTVNDPGSGYDLISGLKINAATYIHESGHLLGLDDYYDYEERQGSNEGLGGADMMDYTVGDQNVYSKIMLGWMEPTIVTQTTTLTIESSQARGEAILIPLNFDNSYFCEYLLIDLYSAQGLNELHASARDSYLYDGASYGVRIYHVSSWANDPFNNDYGSFTDYNNSTTSTPLIKLVEADGERKFSSSRGYASESDLWQTGDQLSAVFPDYTRNDGKKLNFDITVGSVSASHATITVTFY